MKIFEHILDNHILDMIQVIVNHGGFGKNFGTIETIHVAWFPMEKYCVTNRAFYIAFLDLHYGSTYCQRNCVLLRLG